MSNAISPHKNDFFFHGIHAQDAADWHRKRDAGMRLFLFDMPYGSGFVFFVEMAVLRLFHEQGDDEEAGLEGDDDDVEGGDVAERRGQEAHERAREE